MKAEVLFSFMFLILSMFLCLPHTTAEYEPYTQLSLPEGAKARLGKGILSGNMAYSPDSTQLAVASSIGIWIYNTQTGKELSLLIGHQSQVRSVAFSADGVTLAGGSSDGTVRLWHVATGKLKATLTRHENSVDSVGFSPDGTTLAGGSSDGTVRLWHVATGKLKATLTGHRTDVNSIAFSPDGETLASGSSDKTVHLSDVASGKTRRTLTGHTNDVCSVAFSPDGTILASGGEDDTIRLWDVASGETLRTLTGHSGDVYSVAFSPDGKTIASGSSDDTIRLWDILSSEALRTLTGQTGGVRSVAFSPDGKMIASRSEDGTVNLHDIYTGRPIETLTGYQSAVSSFAFNPDGTIIASGGENGTVHLWDVATGTLKAILNEGVSHGVYDGYVGSDGSVYNVVFSSDSTTLMSKSMILGEWDAGMEQYMVRLWDVATGNLKGKLWRKASEINRVAFSPDGITFASRDEGNTTRLWDVTPDGITFASRGANNTVRLWDIPTGTLTRTLKGHQDTVTNVAFSPGNTMLASGSEDGTMLLWKLTPGEYVIVNFRLENGKKVTLYRENEETLVYTFGVPGKKPELEYKGPILADIGLTAALWSDSENTASLKELASWTSSNDDQAIISKAANARDSRGFIRVSGLTGLFSQVVYTFRTGGWEYIIVSTSSRESDYSENSLIVISPDGKLHHLH